MLRRFYPVIFMTILVLVTTSLLTLNNSFTWAKLKAQQDQRTLEVLKIIFPEMSFIFLKVIYVSGHPKPAREGHFKSGHLR